MQINYIVYLIIQIRKTGSQIPRRFPVRHTPDHAEGLQKWNKTQQYEKGPPQAKVKPEKQTADSGRKKGKILGSSEKKEDQKKKAKQDQKAPESPVQIKTAQESIEFPNIGGIRIHKILHSSRCKATARHSPELRARCTLLATLAGNAKIKDFK